MPCLCRAPAKWASRLHNDIHDRNVGHLPLDITCSNAVGQLQDGQILMFECTCLTCHPYCSLPRAVSIEDQLRRGHREVTHWYPRGTERRGDPNCSSRDAAMELDLILRFGQCLVQIQVLSTQGNAVAQLVAHLGCVACVECVNLLFPEYPFLYRTHQEASRLLPRACIQHPMRAMRCCPAKLTTLTGRSTAGSIARVAPSDLLDWTALSNVLIPAGLMMAIHSSALLNMASEELFVANNQGAAVAPTATNITEFGTLIIIADVQEICW
mmetsp:Transcript_96207/g.241132  ORF Transcript_96207/g.241132 Transcript_96207/m.241132 type:complete len:269 (-) Transcript_96207:1976-2782(-)